MSSLYAASIILQIFFVHYALGDYNVQSTTLSQEETLRIINDVLGTDECKYCVPMNKCPKYQNNTLTEGNIYGVGLIDIRIGECPLSGLDICCDEEPAATVITPPKPPQPPSTTNSCGRRNVNGVLYRTLSNESDRAQFAEFNWMIALMTKTERSLGSLLSYKCGGSLIHPKVVLTAAHCVKSYETKPEEIVLRAGEYDSSSESELLPYQQVEAEKIVIHKDFNLATAHNDIALVFLKEPFAITDNIDVVCLPPQNEIVDSNQCIATGWGKEKFSSKTYSNILKRVDLPIVPRVECQERLRKTKLGSVFSLHETFLCAGGILGADTCKGDGGGPLVCPIPGGHPENYYQVGIVAWGVECGTTAPAVYVNIPYFRTWIDEQFDKNNLADGRSYYIYKQITRK